MWPEGFLHHHMRSKDRSDLARATRWLTKQPSLEPVPSSSASGPTLRKGPGRDGQGANTWAVSRPQQALSLTLTVMVGGGCYCPILQVKH